MLQQLKSLQIERLDLYEAVALYDMGMRMVEASTKLEVPVPEWLSDNVKVLRSEIKARSRDALEARLREIRARRATLKTREEQREELEAEEARLNAALDKT